MRDFATTPSIDITIGRQARLYHAFVTTAPAALDSPSTVTLYASTLSDLAGLRRSRHRPRQRERARAVRASSSSMPANWPGSEPAAAAITTSSRPADPVLVSLTSLQHWLWQRLQTPVDPAIDGEEDPRTTSE